MRINPAIFLGRTKDVAITRKWEANTDIDPISLELPGYYCEILLKFLLNVSAVSTPTPETDWQAKVIKSLKIEPTNVAPFLELDDGRQLYYEDFIRAEGSLYVPDLPSAVGETKDVEWQLPIHFGDEYSEAYDISDVIATRGLNNLSFKMRWGSALDLDSGGNYIINSGKVELSIAYVVLQPGISEVQGFPGRAAPPRVARPTIWQPQWHIDKFLDITTPRPSLGYKKNFLNGFFLREVLIMVLKNNVRMDRVLRKLQIANKEGKDFYTKDWEGIELENMRDFHLSEPLVGVAWLDLKEIFHKTAAGLYLVNANDLQWKLTIENVSDAEGNAADIILVYRTHYPIDAKAEIKGAPVLQPG